MSMFGERVPDKSLLKEINKRLSRTGIQAKIVATVRGGYVTLTGVLQYDNQRRMIVRAANQVKGIRQVVDQMTVEARRRAE